MVAIFVISCEAQNKKIVQVEDRSNIGLSLLFDIRVISVILYDA